MANGFETDAKYTSMFKHVFSEGEVIHGMQKFLFAKKRMIEEKFEEVKIERKISVQNGIELEEIEISCFANKSTKVEGKMIGGGRLKRLTELRSDEDKIIKVSTLFQ